MCTLVAGFAPGTSLPLWVAANRDEFLARPASPPRLWPGERFWAPRDETAGGTWLGLSRAGFFVGVTNRFGAEKDEARASRGTLVVEALRAPDPRALHQQLASTSPTRFNAFHLLYADATDAFVTWCDGQTLLQSRLPPGVHVVTERSLGGDDRQRTEHIRARLGAWGEGDPPPTPPQLQALLGVHDADPVGGTCVHLPEWGYGTRSSMLLYLTARRAGARVFWADGPPCVTPYLELSGLGAELFG